MNIFNVDSNLAYLIKVMGKNISINNTMVKAIVQDTEYKDVEEKKIIAKHPFKRGDLITYNNHPYLIVNEINSPKRDSYYRGFMQSCNYSVKFIIDGQVREFPAIIRGKVFDTSTGRYMDLSANEIEVTMQLNKYTNSIKDTMRFIKFQKAWAIAGINYTKQGLIVLNAKTTSVMPNDDMVNEIADKNTIINYRIEANNIEVSKGGTAQINVKLFANDVEVTNPELTYTVSDANICTVSNTGMVTGLIEGNTTITINYKDIASKTINARVVLIPVENYALGINGATSMYRNATENYSAYLTNNGVDVSSNFTYNWSLTNKDGSSNVYAIIKSITPAFGKDCTIEAKSTTYVYLTLTCQCREKPNLTFSKDIEITDYFLYQKVAKS